MVLGSSMYLFFYGMYLFFSMECTCFYCMFFVVDIVCFFVVIV
jgi:hypothetical protein